MSPDQTNDTIGLHVLVNDDSAATPPQRYACEWDGDNYTSGTIHSDRQPTSSVVTVLGQAVVSGKLTGSYTYADADLDVENGTTFKWYRANDAAGSGKTAILGATGKTYTLTSDDTGKYISFEVTPKNIYGTGTAVESSAVGPAGDAPVAYSVSIAKTTDGAENNGGTPTDAVFTITVTPQNDSDGAITGDIAYTGTASDADYATGAATFSIANGQSSTTVTLDVTEDDLVEGTETIIATLSNPSLPALAGRGIALARSANDSIALGTTSSATANITDDDTTPTPTDDADGVDAATENQAPNSGDGNNDGIPDSAQGKVTSVKEASGSAYFTVDATGTGCTQITNVSATTESALGSGEDPAGFEYQSGLVEFKLEGCTTADMAIYFYGLTQKPDQIRKYGLLADRVTRGWYSLADAGITVNIETNTTIIQGETVYIARYTLKDGEQGDDDTTIGTITDPVGAGQLGAKPGGGVGGSGTPVNVPTLSEWVQYLLILLLATAGLRLGRQRKVRGDIKSDT